VIVGRADDGTGRVVLPVVADLPIKSDLHDVVKMGGADWEPPLMLDGN
jgi:hypothetical protein